MKIIKTKNKFNVESHIKGKYYIVDLNKETCTCPHYMFRMSKIGDECKHLKAVREKYAKKTSKKSKNLLDYVKEKVSVDSIEALDKYGEVVDELIEKGELIEDKGKLKILE